MIINASAHNIPLADKSIHAVVTSPPYFGLRKYVGKTGRTIYKGYGRLNLKTLRAKSPFVKGRESAAITKANKRKACQAAYRAGFSNRIKQVPNAQKTKRRPKI